MRQDLPSKGRSVGPEPAPRFLLKSWPRPPRPPCAKQKQHPHSKLDGMGLAGCTTYSLPSSRYRARETYSLPSSRSRAPEAASLSRSSVTRPTGTTDVKTKAELFEQTGAVVSAVGTTRAAVRRPISESRDYVLRAALPRAPGRRPRSSGRQMDYGVGCTHAISRMDCDEGIEERPETELSNQVRRLDSTCTDARSRSSFLLGT